MNNFLRLGLFILISFFSAGCSSGDSYSSYSSSQYSAQETITQDEAILAHWDEVKDYLPSSATVEACSDSSGNCYDLEADINGGAIETIHFDNSGYLNFGVEIDSVGSASATDYEGNGWSFQMNESVIDQAVQDWADANNLEIE